MRSSEPYRGVLFDLDGTLTNTLQDIADAMNRSLRLHSLPEWPLDAYRYLVGNGAVNLSKKAVRDRQDLQPEVLRDYQAWYERHAMVKTCPYPGIPELLRALRERGMKLCVFSNKPHADTVNVVRHYFPEIPFDEIRGQQPGIPVKPDPQGALLAAEKMGLKPEEILYLGDTSVDMLCARNAGMRPIGVLWGFREEEELVKAGAEGLLKEPMELMNLL